MAEPELSVLGVTTGMKGPYHTLSPTDDYLDNLAQLLLFPSPTLPVGINSLSLCMGEHSAHIRNSFAGKICGGACL